MERFTISHLFAGSQEEKDRKLAWAGEAKTLGDLSRAIVKASGKAFVRNGYPAIASRNI